MKTKPAAQGADVFITGAVPVSFDEPVVRDHDGHVIDPRHLHEAAQSCPNEKPADVSVYCDIRTETFTFRIFAKDHEGHRVRQDPKRPTMAARRGT